MPKRKDLRNKQLPESIIKFLWVIRFIIWEAMTEIDNLVQNGASLLKLFRLNIF